MQSVGTTIHGPIYQSLDAERRICRQGKGLQARLRQLAWLPLPETTLKAEQ